MELFQKKITIVIPGKPTPLQRARSFRKGAGIGHYDAQKKEKKRDAILCKHQMRTQGMPAPIRGLVFVEAVFCMGQARKRTPGVLDGDYFMKKPDLDNILKYYLDAFNGVLFDDDSQVVMINSKKIYSFEQRSIITVSFYVP